MLKHTWFTEGEGAIDWRKLVAKGIDPPWKPLAATPTDVRYFDGGEINDSVNKKWKDPEPGWDSSFADELA